MADKPEALIQRLEKLGQDGVGNYGMPICAEAAAELRRLHDETLMLEGAYESACKILSEQDKKLAELEAVNRELLEALRLTSIDCQYLHHAHKDRHLLFEECPVVARINAAIAKAEGEKT